MKPYLSTSRPFTSSQSSIPPANSCSCLVDIALPGLCAVPFALGLRCPFALYQSAEIFYFPRATYVGDSSWTTGSSSKLDCLAIAEYFLSSQSKAEPCSYIDLTFCDSFSRSSGKGNVIVGEAIIETPGCLQSVSKITTPPFRQSLPSAAICTGMPINSLLPTKHHTPSLRKRNCFQEPLIQ